MAKPQADNSDQQRDPRILQVVVAFLVLFVLTVCVVGALMGWRHLPEIWSDWIGTIVGVMSTPFLLEASFIFIGLTIVVAINHWRQKRAGDDFVELEVSDPRED